MTTISRIRTEIERRHAYQKEMYNKTKPDGRPNDGWAESLAIMGELEELLAFLDTLPEQEPQVNLEKEIEEYIKGCLGSLEGQEIASCARYFYELGQQSRPKISDTSLEEEISRFFDAVDARTNGRWAEDDILECARHFAEWGARHSINWGDVQLLDTFILELSREEKDGADWGDSEKFYTEVLRRFHEFNDKKIPEIVAEWGAEHLKK